MFEEENRSKRAATEAFGGLNSYPDQTAEQLATKERTETRKKIAKTGYYAVAEDVWRELQDEGSVPEDYKDAAAMRAALIAETLAKIAQESPDADPLLAQAAAEYIVGESMPLRAYAWLTEKRREEMRATNADLRQWLVNVGEQSAGAALKEQIGAR